MPVADQQQRRPGRTGHPLGLLQPAQVARRQVGGAAGLDSPDGCLDGRLVGQGAGGDDDPHGVVEGDDAEVVGRVEPVDQRYQRGLGTLETVAGHGAAAVEDNLQRRRLPRRGDVGPGGGQLDEQCQLVGLFDGDDVAVEKGGQVHGHSKR